MIVVRTPNPPVNEPRSALTTGGALEALPFLTAVVALFVPLAAAIYLLTTSGWTLGERLVLRRLYPPPQAS